ncbi:MAG TPA: DUF1566 domain-containing protein [Byssovorax sp.]|jgi:hypothetical protein
MGWFQRWFGYGLGVGVGKAVIGDDPRRRMRDVHPMTEEEILADERRYDDDERRLDAADAQPKAEAATPSPRVSRSVCLAPRGFALAFAVAAAHLLVGCASAAESESLGVTDSATEDLSGGAFQRTTPVCGKGCKPMCVEPGRYLANDDVVWDAETHVVWQRNVPPRVDHARAANVCRELVLGGRADWRLPTLAELESIVLDAGGLEAGRPQYCDPAIDQAAFPLTPDDFFWTSSVDREAGVADYVSFFDGRTHNDLLSAPLRVRCVAP